MLLRADQEWPQSYATSLHSQRCSGGASWRFLAPILPPTGWIRGKKRSRVTPLMRRGQASERGTTQLQFSSGRTPNVHLPAFKFPPAKNADPLVIERIPTPERIAYAQNRESIVEIKVSDHVQRAFCSLHQGTQSEHWMIMRSDKTL